MPRLILAAFVAVDVVLMEVVFDGELPLWVVAALTLVQVAVVAVYAERHFSRREADGG